MILSSSKQLALEKANFPSNVHLFSTTRYFNGAGLACSGNSNYADFNLATHTGDDINAVERNRDQLVQKFKLPNKPKYLEQMHSNICLQASSDECVGDAVITKSTKTICAILTADCLPIFISNKSGTQVGVAHAGWKGVINGIIESLVNQFDSHELLVHFGPAISQKHFEVGQEVYQQFIDKNIKFKGAFIPSGNNHKLDLYQAARIILNELGVKSISGGDECTFAQQDRYFSYRRDGAHSGRMVHLIWME